MGTYKQCKQSFIRLLNVFERCLSYVHHSLYNYILILRNIFILKYKDVFSVVI